LSPKILESTVYLLPPFVSEIERPSAPRFVSKREVCLGFIAVPGGAGGATTFMAVACWQWPESGSNAYERVLAEQYRSHWRRVAYVRVTPHVYNPHD
jgi:hypothetical protein